MVTVGVLALQGDFKDHSRILKKLRANVKEVRNRTDILEVDGLIIPGGESTTMTKLMRKYDLDKAVKEKFSKGMPIYGSCAGAILLAKEVFGETKKLGLADFSAKRNAYGRQLESFEADVDIKGQRKKFPAIFIRAPKLSVNGSAEVLAEHEGIPILVKEKNILASTFHPELTNDLRIHKIFLKMIKDGRAR